MEGEAFRPKMIGSPPPDYGKTLPGRSAPLVVSIVTPGVSPTLLSSLLGSCIPPSEAVVESLRGNHRERRIRFWALSRNPRVRLLHGSFKPALLELAPRPCLALTVLEQPAWSAVRAYQHLRRHRPQIVAGLTAGPEAFFASPAAKPYRNRAVRFLAGARSQQDPDDPALLDLAWAALENSFCWVGVTSRWRQSLEALGGILEPHGLRLGLDKVARTPRVPGDLSPDSESALLDANALDTALYERALIRGSIDA